MPWPMRTGPLPMTRAAGRSTGGASGADPGDPPPQQPEQPPQPRVRRLEEALQHDRRRAALREPGALAGLAGIVDPADRLVLVGIAGVDPGEVVERRRPRRILRQWPGTG